MNDRYLYRAKRIDNGEWVYGDLVHSVYKKTTHVLVDMALVLEFIQ